MPPHSETLIENVRDGGVVANLAGNLVPSNSAGLRMHGLPADGTWRVSVARLPEMSAVPTLHGPRLDRNDRPTGGVLRGERAKAVVLSLLAEDGSA